MPHRDEAFIDYSPQSLSLPLLHLASRSNPRPLASLPLASPPPPPRRPLLPLVISRLANSRVSRRPPGSSSARRAPLKLRIARTHSAHSLFPSPPPPLPRRRRAAVPGVGASAASPLTIGYGLKSEIST